MSNFQTRLLTDVGKLYETVFAARVAAVRPLARVSDKARSEVLFLLLDFDRLCALDPFPEEADTDRSALDQLQSDLEATDHNAAETERILSEWVQNLAPRPGEPEMKGGDAEVPEVSPINQRMLDATAALRSAIDATRGKLMLSDPYDFADYKIARNDFTLTRAAYDKRLRDGSISASVEDASRAERELKPAIKAATGATFPQTIQEAADFMRSRIFVFQALS